MLKTLASHNKDVNRLLEKGYALSVDSNCLVVRDVPYLDHEGKLRRGAMVSKLVFINDVTVKPDGHQMWFAGETPHGVDRSPVRGLGGGPGTLQLTEACKDIPVQRSFSHKLKNAQGVRDYVDLFEKVESYIAMISGPAMMLHDATPLTFRAVEPEDVPSVFKVRDTLTTRAELSDLVKAFSDDVVAIIGLGGTGAYVMDLMVKTPVREIRAFDLDRFYVHNAFRSPGRLLEEEFGKYKSDVYGDRYVNFRHGLRCAVRYIDESSRDQLDGVTFAFVCVDKGSARARIFDLLISAKLPFIDVGMGLNRKQGPISGTVRTSYFEATVAADTRAKRLAPEHDHPDDIYRTNIQIAELNALNACLAVIKFKQIRGFYINKSTAAQYLFGIDNLSMEKE